MIITRTPFRASFLGGGTDLPPFYRRNGHGEVLSSALRRYMYIVIHPYFHNKIRIKYSRTEDVEEVEQIEHPIVRECLRKLDIDKGVEIASFADVASGTGLGSSSAFTVGLLNALYAYRGEAVDKERLAREACEIEIEILGEPIGKQDQYAAAYGGTNRIRFNADESVEVTPLPLGEEARARMEREFRLYFTGGQRSASAILREQQDNLADDRRFALQRGMLEAIPDFARMLTSGDLTRAGVLLDDSWRRKRELAGGISNDAVDALYRRALELGASGGKLLGAGGAGFLLLHHTDHDALAAALDCRTLPFEMDDEGSRLMRCEPG